MGQSSQPRPEVSVSIPVYNGEEFIGQAIESVLSQSFHDLECVVIDNASRDRTVEIARSFNDKRLKILVNEENLGAEKNWNLALDHARGTYVKILPADDYLLPDCLEGQTAVLRHPQNQSVVLVFGPRQVIDSRGKKIMERGLAGKGLIPGSDCVRTCIKTGTNVIGEPGAVLFRKDISEKAGYFNARLPYVVDLDYWVRLLQFGDGWSLDRPVSAFRISMGSWSNALAKKQGEQYRQFIWAVKELTPTVTSFDRLRGSMISYINQFLRNVLYTILKLTKRK